MNEKRTKPKKVRRQIFVFTPEEKKAGACVLFAFFLGLGTMYYRKHHPHPPPPLTAREQYQKQRAEKAAKAYARSARGREAAAKDAAARATPTSTPLADEDDEGD